MYSCFANSFYFLIFASYLATHLLRIPFQLPHKKIDWLSGELVHSLVSTTRSFRIWKQQKVTDFWLGSVFYGMYNNYDDF